MNDRSLINMNLNMTVMTMSNEINKDDTLLGKGRKRVHNMLNNIAIFFIIVAD